MIYYFSGTGNSEWVAKTIANGLNDNTQDIIKLIKSYDKKIEIPMDANIGIVFPIYAWAIPEPIDYFIKKVNIPKDSFTFAIATCGEEAGLALSKLSKAFKINSTYSIAMPNNYIIGSDVFSVEITNKTIELAKKKIDKIIEDIKDKKSTSEVNKGKLSFVKSNIIAPAFNKFARDIKPFYVEDSCIGCGLCEKNCPTGCITLKDKKPVWNGHCYQCLSCINRCPKQSIQYGSKTKNRGRYYMK